MYIGDWKQPWVVALKALGDVARGSGMPSRATLKGIRDMVDCGLTKAMVS